MNKDSKKNSLSKFKEVNKMYAFLKGLGEVRQKDAAACKAELMAALRITTEPTFTRRKRGQVVPTVEEYAAIISVFKRYGVTQPFGV